MRLVCAFMTPVTPQIEFRRSPEMWCVLITTKNQQPVYEDVGETHNSILYLLQPTSIKEFPVFVNLKYHDAAWIDKLKWVLFGDVHCRIYSKDLAKAIQLLSDQKRMCWILYNLLKSLSSSNMSLTIARVKTNNVIFMLFCGQFILGLFRISMGR